MPSSSGTTSVLDLFRRAHQKKEEEVEGTPDEIKNVAFVRKGIAPVLRIHPVMQGKEMQLLEPCLNDVISMNKT